MMEAVLLLLALASQASFSSASCPLKTESVGVLRSDIGGCGLEGCEARYQDNYASIAECAAGCEARKDCVSFTWAPMDDDTNHPGKSVCTLYNSDVPNQLWGHGQQIMCRLLRCPSGSHQIGGLNTDIGGCGVAACDTRYDLDTITQCMQRCASDARCASYSWAPLDGDKNHDGEKVCTIYDTTAANQVWGPEQILCKRPCQIATNGQTAWMSGDPHFWTFNGATNNFQGPSNVPEEERQYYLSTSCDTNDRVNQPFSVIGTFYPFNTQVTGLHYVTIALYEGPDTYYVFLDTRADTNYYGREADGVTSVWDPNAAGLTVYNAGTTSIGQMFEIVLSGSATDRTITLYIDDDDDVATPPCVVTIRLRREGQTGSPLWYWHYFAMTPPECYRCTTCGLLGDFQSPWGSKSLLRCDGSRQDYTEAALWLPGTLGYDPSGMSWQKLNVEEGCRSNPQVIAGSDGCNEGVYDIVVEKCQEARDGLRRCCYEIGGSFCDVLHTACEIDVCILGTDYPDRIDEFIANQFVADIEEECANHPGEGGPFPFLLYEFDGDLSETISGKDPKYDLQIRGDAHVGEGVLFCDGAGDYVFGEHNLDMGFVSHSLEVLVQITNLDIRSGGMISLDSKYTNDEPASGYAHDQFDSIVYAERVPGKTMIGSEYFRRTDTQDGGMSAATPNTEYVATNYVAETVANEFVHFVATFDVENNRAKLYRNGVVQLDYIPTGGFMVKEADYGVRVMFCERHLGAGGSEFSGKIRFGAFYDTAISGDEVRQLLEAKVNTDFADTVELIGDELRPGDTLQQEQALRSVDGLFLVLMQRDSNLCTYETPVRGYDWCAFTQETEAQYLRYNEDGSVALYDSHDALVKELAEANGDAGRLIMTRHGDLRAYDGEGKVYWRSGGEAVGQCASDDWIAAWYDGSSLDLAVPEWKDLSGKDNTGVITGSGIGVFDGTAEENAELYLNGEPVVYGTHATKVAFGLNLVVGEKHTVFNLCKYRVTGSKGRIINAGETNSLFGFWGGRSGVAHEQGWETDTSNRFGNEWVLSTQTHTKYRGNRVNYADRTAGGVPNGIGHLYINGGMYSNEVSDWACAEVLIVNKELTDAEIECVEEYFRGKYDLAPPPAAQSGLFNFDMKRVGMNGEAGTYTSALGYLMYAIMVLLAVNVIGAAVVCCRRKRKVRYKVVSVDTDTDIDSEDQVLVKS